MVRVHADPARHLHQIELSRTSPEKMNQPPVRRTQVYLLMLLFFGPLLGAGLLYFVFPQWQPQSRTNYGELINPARPAPDDLRLQPADGKQVGVEALRQRWTYLYVGGESCEQACQDTLRSEERRVGKEGFRTCRSRGSPVH